MNFISLFSGIGGFDYGFMKAGWKCVGWCELDKFAHKAFGILHDPKGEIPNEFDVRNVSDGFVRLARERSGTIDAIIGGFPCQAFSIAGKREGFKDQTRGTLFFEIMRISEIAKPRLLILENVKGLLNHGGGNTFQIIINTLDELGYDCEWQVLNSKDFGVPQNRERVFIVGYLRGTSRSKVFPIEQQNNGIIEVVGRLDIKGKDQIRRIYSPDHLSPCLSTMQGGNQEPKIVLSVLTPDRIEKRQNGRRFKENGEPAFTLTAQDRHGIVIVGNLKPDHCTRLGQRDEFYDAKGIIGALNASDYKQPRRIFDMYRIRKLTPLECFRLQSYPDEWYNTLKEHGFSDSQLYKMAGNGVTSNVSFEIAKRLKVNK